MGATWDAERGAKAAVWVGFYVLLWLLMQLSCELGFPGNCRRSYEPMDVLTEMPFLLAFALGQAFLCDILDPKRFQGLAKKWYFPVIVVGSGIITSALMENKVFVDIHESEEDLTPAEDMCSILLVIFVCLIFVYHLFLAWKLLPGAVLVSGGIPLTAGETAADATGNRFAQNLAITLLIAVYVALYGTFAYRRGDGWEYHYILLSWVLSLIATFDDAISVMWLGITIGAFVQGVGAYSFGFLFHAN